MAPTAAEAPVNSADRPLHSPLCAEAPERPAWGMSPLLLSLLLLCAALFYLSPRAETPQAALSSEGSCYVQPLGPVSPREIARASWALRQGCERPVVVLPTKAMSLSAHEQHDARSLLDLVLTYAPEDAFRILGVTAAPLSTPHDGPVIGYARRSERALIYSSAQLSSEATEATLRARVLRVVRHELGHTFGAGHCTQHCLMHSTHAARDIDLLPETFCRTHAAQYQRGLSRGLDHPKEQIARAGESLRSGQWGQAIDRLREAARQSPHDVRLQTSLGIAQLASGATTSAEETFREAISQHPRAAQPYYGLAVLLALGPHPQRAPAYLEAAVQRDADPLRAHRAAGILYQDVLHNRAQAKRHYKAHIQHGGQDREVLSRISQMMAPATLIFMQPEVIIARWDPLDGLIFARAH